jgi:DNA-binding MarR family transcriptional regulator
MNESRNFHGESPHPNGESPNSREIEIAATMRTVIHRLVKVLRRETRNEGNLSLTERSTMGSLYHHQELPPTELAQLEKVTTQSMSQIINHLFDLNFIHKTPSGEDKRKVLLSLTPAGKTYVENNRQRKVEWLARALHENTSPEEKELLMKAMQVMAKLVDQ